MTPDDRPQEPALAPADPVGGLTIESQQLGTITVPPASLITFEGGLFGFPRERTYCLVEVRPGARFQLLQCCERADLAFVVVNPEQIVAEYDVEQLRPFATPPLDEDEGLGVAAIVTVPKAPGRMTVNLLAPLVVGVRSRRGIQVVLEGGYSVRHEI